MYENRIETKAFCENKMILKCGMEVGGVPHHPDAVTITSQERDLQKRTDRDQNVSVLYNSRKKGNTMEDIKQQLPVQKHCRKRNRRKKIEVASPVKGQQEKYCCVERNGL